MKKHFKGRMNRITFLVAELLTIIHFFGVLAILVYLGDGRLTDDGFFIFLPTFFIVAYTSFSIFLRRSHDFGDGWDRVIIGMIPVVRRFNLGYMFFKQGDIGENKYGPPPKPGVNWKQVFLLE